jgi:hypothetical protein
MTTIFVEAPVNQSFVTSVQRLASVKIYATQNQDIFKLFPRVIDITIGYDLYEVCKKLPHNTSIIVVRDELTFLSEAFLIMEAASKNMAPKIYVTPFDITGSPLISYNLIFNSARHWCIGASPNIKTFAVINSAFLEDEEIWKQFKENVWNGLEVLGGRRVATPIPSLSAKPNEFPPGINWPK